MSIWGEYFHDTPPARDCPAEVLPGFSPDFIERLIDCNPGREWLGVRDPWGRAHIIQTADARAYVASERRAL